MKSTRKIAFAVLIVVLGIPTVTMAQRKPRLRRAAPRTAIAPIVPIGTNLKVRLNDTLSSKDSRAGDKFTATAIDKLKELWNAEVPPETISHTLGRPESEVRAKAAELRLPQHVTARAGR